MLSTKAMQALKQNLGPIALAIGLVAVFALTILVNRPTLVEGSTARGSEYQGTTTVSTAGIFPAEAKLVGTTDPTPGVFGQVTITGASAGSLNFYDATTSDITKRAASMSTSSILLASFPNSVAAGTYVFDRVFVNGLYIVTAGTLPTSSIMYRQ